MRRLACFGLLALIPAALNVTTAEAATMAMPLCGGDGQVRTIEVPLGQPGQAPEPCCAKGCHAGGSRKKAARQFEPSQ